MQTYVESGDTLTLTAPSGGVVSGNFYLIGNLYGVAAYTASAGEDFVLKTCGVYDQPKTSALAIAVGDLLYWDNTNKEFNKTASGNTLAGKAVLAAANPSSTVRIRLNP